MRCVFPLRKEDNLIIDRLQLGAAQVVCSFVCCAEKVIRPGAVTSARIGGAFDWSAEVGVRS